MIEHLKRLADKQLSDKKYSEEYQKYWIIRKILEEKNCFFKMDIEYAYAILRDLGIREEELEDIYLELIDVEARES